MVVTEEEETVVEVEVVAEVMEVGTSTWAHTPLTNGINFQPKIRNA